jgi:hypothetical protein
MEDEGVGRRDRGGKEGAESRRGFLGFLFGGLSVISPPLSYTGFSCPFFSISLARFLSLARSLCALQWTSWESTGQPIIWSSGKWFSRGKLFKIKGFGGFSGLSLFAY